MDKLLQTQAINQYELESFIKNIKKTPLERRKESYYKKRLEILETIWEQCRKTHRELLGLHKAEDDERPYFAQDTFAGIEENYCVAYELIQTQLKALFPTEAQISITQPPANNHDSNELRLPRINIPRFSGSYQNWSSFYDLFTAIVHNNTKISDVQKLHYLKTSLTGEAEHLIKHLQITENNYLPAWEILIKRYQNPRALVNAQLQALTSIPTRSAETSKGIKELLDKINEILEALKALHVDIKNWDPLLVHLLTQKLSSETVTHWETVLSSRNDSTAIPTIQEFTNFLETRFRTLEAIASSKIVIRQAHEKYKPQDRTRVHLNTDHTSCTVCSGNHRLNECRKFLQMNVNERFRLIKNQSRCLNCLAATHSTNNCTNPMNCKRCGKRHHTMLHFEPKSEAKAINKNPISQPTIPCYQPYAGSAAKPNKFSQITTTPGNRNNMSSQQTHLAHFHSNESFSTVNESDSEVVNMQQNSNPLIQNYSHMGSDRSNQTILLATALICAESSVTGKHLLRALLDQGSQASFITEEAVQRMKLSKKPSYTYVTGLGKSEAGVARSSVCLTIRPHFASEFTIQVKPLVLKTITGLLPPHNLKPNHYTEFPEVTLADPYYHQPGHIDMLLGADIYAEIICGGVLKGPKGVPMAQETTLGWILSGQAQQIDYQSSDNTFHTRLQPQIQIKSEENLETLLRQFWEIEEIQRKSPLNPKEELCEKLYENSYSRCNDGRYMVTLPFESFPNYPELGESRSNAMKRMLQMEKKFAKCPEFQNQYQAFMNEYLTLGHMKRVSNESTNPSNSYYLPHHAVMKEDSTTTKLRVVFDASCKTTNLKSLNDSLLAGPTLQQDLTTILLRWRKHQIVFTGDIEKMYRQILVAPEHTRYQKVLWRNTPTEEVQEFELLTVTYGTTCAPYLAIKTMRQLALDESTLYPLAAEVALKDFYVDDLLSGASNVHEAVEIQNQLRAMFKSGGFNIRKWASNREELLQNIPTEERSITKPLNIYFNETIKTLGIQWNPLTDHFEFEVKRNLEKTVTTKRTLLSQVARIFDPLGWLAPVIITAKIMFQKLWLAGIGWDDELPEQLANSWKHFRNDLYQIENLTVPRWLYYVPEKGCFQLHGFCDASQQAYSAVVYSRYEDEQGNVNISLVTAKTKVAPLKQVSLPRLELCGAVLVSRLLRQVREALEIQNVTIHAWTDSTIVLAWLSAMPSKWKTFVANRVSEIQQNWNINQWSHVKSEDNPADCASRGISPNKLKSYSLWWSGPTWLKHPPELWPRDTKTLSTTNLEERKVNTLVSQVKTPEIDILSRFSSLNKTKRVTAYCIRFCHNLRNKDNKYSGYLTSQELRDALKVLIKLDQRENFSKEIIALHEGKELPKESRITNLNPFVDEGGLLRVGGRLRHSELQYNEKFPIILNDKSVLTYLIIDEVHKTTLHGGTQLTLNMIRKNYWILRARSVVKQQIHKCIKCYRYIAQNRTQLMADLPTARIRACRPFLQTGVDFAGPITIKESKCRGRVKTSKAYISVFICLATRAIHLEAVSDLSSEAFLAAFRRFTSRRGLCTDMYSDCGTNFVGANSQLTKAHSLQEIGLPNELREILANKGTNWHFIPPASPHFGGLWEAGVKSTKYHLKRVLGNYILTFEELSTVLAQIEACLNSRPLCPLTSDPQDCTALTPGHFLVGDVLLASPEPNLLDKNINVLKRWQMLQRLHQDFWKRWSIEYLNRLQQRPKWTKMQPNSKIGDLVLIKDERLPPCNWLMGRIISLHPGKDNLIRVVTLKCKDTILKRPITKICPLPIEDNGGDA